MFAPFEAFFKTVESFLSEGEALGVAFEDFPESDGEDGDGHGEGEECSETDDDAHRHPKAGVSDDHGDDAESGGAGGEEDGAHAALASQIGCLTGGHVFFVHQGVGIFVHDDRIADNDADQRDEAEDSRNGERQIENDQTQTAAENAQSRDRKSKKADGDFFEVVEQESEEDDQRSDDSQDEVGHYQTLDFVDAAIIDGYLRAIDGFDVFPDIFFDRVDESDGGSRAVDVGSHGDGGDAVGAFDVGSMEIGFDVGHLTERDPGARSEAGDKEVADIVAIDIFGAEGIDADGRFVLSVPDGGEALFGESPVEVERKARLCDSELGGLFFAECDPDGFCRLVIGGMDPGEVVHRCHEAFDAIGHNLKHGAVGALDVDFDGVVDSLIVDLFEADVGVRESVFVEGRIFFNQFDCGVVADGVDDKLAVAGAAYLRGIDGMETRA